MGIRSRDHSLSRMLQHAVQVLADSEVLEEARRDTPGAYLLQLLALEILLKAGALHETGSFPTVHKVDQLFDLQSTAMRNRVQKAFLERELQFTPAVAAPLDDQLKTLGHNFVKFRYVYEAWFSYTESERHTREQEFIDGALPVSESDVVYHQELLDILLGQLLEDLAPWAPTEAASLRWCT